MPNPTAHPYNHLSIPMAESGQTCLAGPPSPLKQYQLVSRQTVFVKQRSTMSDRILVPLDVIQRILGEIVHLLKGLLREMNSI